MATFKDKLRGMQSNWDDSQNSYDSMFGGVKIDAGQYVAKLQSAKIVESKSSGKLMIRREHVILEGEFSGMVLFDNLQLETPMGLTFLRRWFDQMGYEPPQDPSEIEETVSAITSDAATVKIIVKHSGDFVNVSVIEVIDGGEKEEQPAEELKAKAKAEPKAEQAAPKSAKQKRAPEPEPEPEADDDDTAELVAKLTAFCKAQDIETESDDTVDVLCERIKEYDWPREELTEEEIAMFTEAGIESVIISPKKASKVKK